VTIVVDEPYCCRTPRPLGRGLGDTIVLKKYDSKWLGDQIMLAIGINFEHQGFAASRVVDSKEPQEVANFLNEEFQIFFDQILVVQNDEVIEHWNLGEDYEES
jgi:hypothetical protein